MESIEEQRVRFRPMPVKTMRSTLEMVIIAMRVILSYAPMVLHEDVGE